MRALLIGVGVSLSLAMWPAWSQTTSPPSQVQAQANDQNAPGTGGVSKPGVPGKPGSKAGPTVSPSTGSSLPEASDTTKLQDQSKVPGLSGSKSGPSSSKSSGAAASGSEGTASGQSKSR
jgi:hypothetical protein